MVANCGWGADKSDWQIGQACHKNRSADCCPWNHAHPRVGVRSGVGAEAFVIVFVSKIALLVNLAMLLYASNSVYLMH